MPIRFPGVWCATVLRLPVLVLLFALAACQRPAEEKSALTLTDDLGRNLPLQTRPKRVMALAPSATEMLALLIPREQIIGRTQQCNFPEWVLQKPVVNSYPLDVEKLLQLKPDLVITLEGMTSLENADKLQQLGVPVYFQKFEDVNDVLTGIEKLGEMLDRQERAKQITDSLRKELEKVAENFNPKKRMASVIALAWQDPILVYGRNTLFTDKIMRAGGVNAIDTVFDNPYPPITREHLLKINPDILISHTYTFAQMDTSFFRLYPELRTLKAYQTKRIYPINPDLMERPGPRVVESVKELQRIVNR